MDLWRRLAWGKLRRRVLGIQLQSFGAALPSVAFFTL